jgi:outer membrane protein assembly factor BamB
MPERGIGVVGSGARKNFREYIFVPTPRRFASRDRTDPPYDYRHSSPVAAGGVAYVGSADGNLYAVDMATGPEKWRVETNGSVRTTPLIDRGSVYVGSWSGALHAVDAETGEPRWEFDTGGIIQGDLAIADGKIVVGSRSARMFAVNADSGQPAWEYLHEDGSWVESSPVIHEGVVYIGSSDALKLSAFELDTGNELWSFKTNGWSWGTPVVAGNAVYVGGI